MKFEIYRTRSGWRWRLKAANGKIIADSGEAYKRSADCLRGINMVRIGTDERTPVEEGKR